VVDWHRSWKADVGLRALGLACWALAYAAIAQLLAAPPPATGTPDLLPLALAAGGFLGASAGAALTVWGKHLFDEVAVSARWRRSNAPSARRRAHADASTPSAPVQ
jgi:hypothetical protein